MIDNINLSNNQKIISNIRIERLENLMNTKTEKKHQNEMINTTEDMINKKKDSKRLERKELKTLERKSLEKELVLYRVHGDMQASGALNFHYMQVQGKLAFYKKYEHELSSPTKRSLKIKSGHYLVMGKTTLKEKLLGFKMIISSNPFKLFDIFIFAFRKIRSN